MDIVSPQRRSAMMSGIKGCNTRPELAVRRAAHRLGLRFRLYRKDLPGTPDLVFPGRRKVVFVHGCFWHRHAGCKYAYTPKSNLEFWLNKLQNNVKRDLHMRRQLESGGWTVIVIWECETKDEAKLVEILSRQVRNVAG
ncbi:DNA mismatch endonuclease Vsr [Mesorhizobium sp. M1406]|uniref:very short patch repair endonuclease n=1 Tax=Mesorhizobium sp. M1406 TaxID=2957099 RepID=UPI0033355D3D